MGFEHLAKFKRVEDAMNGVPLLIGSNAEEYKMFLFTGILPVLTPPLVEAVRRSGFAWKARPAVVAAADRRKFSPHERPCRAPRQLWYIAPTR